MGAASDPFMAAQQIQEEIPDVITLDVEMPRMDGITFLRKLMAQRPIPVVMCSSLTEDGSETLLQALEAGAVDVILKPQDRRRRLPRRIAACASATRSRRAAHVRGSATRRRRRPQTGVRPPKLTADAVLPPPTGRAMAETTEMVVCVGASTGGTEALREVLEQLPANSPGIVIVQHMPEKFTAAFAKRLEQRSARSRSRKPSDGDPVLRGQVLIAPGDQPHAARAQRRALLSSRSRTARWSRATGRRSTCCSARPPAAAGRQRRSASS